MISKIRWFFLLFIILMLASFLRFYNLGRESLWYDETFSVEQAINGWSSSWERFDGRVYPWLFEGFLSIWIKFFGSSESAVRFPSSLLGVGSVLVLFLVGNKLYNLETGLWSSFLLGISIFHIDVSQEARGYSLMVFLTLTSVIFFLQILSKRETNSTKEKIVPWIGCALVNGLLGCAHFYGFFVPVWEGIVYVMASSYIKKWKALLHWIGFQSIGMLVFIPLLKPFLRTVKTVKHGFWLSHPSFNSLIETFYLFSNNSYPLMIGFLSLVGLCLFLFLTKKEFLFHFSYYIILLWFLVPVVAGFVLSFIFKPIYLPKYIVGASPAFFILVGRGISCLPKERMKKIVFLIILIFSVSNIFNHYGLNNKENWRDSVKYLETHWTYGEPVVILERFSWDWLSCPVRIYVTNRAIVDNVFELDENKITDRKSIEKIIKIKDNSMNVKYLWIVLRNYEGEKSIKYEINKTYRVLEAKSFSGINVFYVRLKGMDFVSRYNRT